MKAKAQIFNYPLVVVFFAIIFLPGINGALGVREFERKDENRAFRDSVEFDISNLDIFPGEFEEFYNDNFSFRRPLLDVYHYIKFWYYKVSPHPDKTIIGRNDWFFNAGKEKDIFEGKLNFSDEDLEKFKNEWGKRRDYLDSLNIKYYWVICPFKHHIYPEYLPFNVSRYNETKRVDQLKTYFDGDFPGLIIDPTSELLTVKENMKLYYKLDNHWNFYAGYITSKLLLSKIKPDFPERDIPDIPTYTWVDSTRQGGIHYKVLGLESLFEVDKYPVVDNEGAIEAKKYGFPPQKGFAYPWNYERRFVNSNDTSGLTVLVIRDSYGSQLLPFIKEPFKESVFIFDSWQYKLNKPIIEVVKPDIIVFIGLETHLESIIKENN